MRKSQSGAMKFSITGKKEQKTVEILKSVYKFNWVDNYLFDKEFGDPITLNAIHNQTDYIKLLIAGKRILKKSGMIILPYVISSRVTRVATRKIISKKDMVRMENSDLYQQIKAKYNNPKIEQKIWEFIGCVISSSYEIIDFDEEHNCPSTWDGTELPIINDMINEELMFFITVI